MKEIQKRDTAVLLASLEGEIELKCVEIKEKQREAMLRKIFFSVCLFVVAFVVFEMFFKVFNFGIIFGFLVYQGIALIAAIPLIFKWNKGAL